MSALALMVMVCSLGSGFVLGSKNYSSYQVLQITVESSDDVLQVVNFLNDGTYENDIWQWPTHEYMYLDVMISKDDLPEIQLYLNTSAILYDVKIADVQSIIDQSQRDGARAGARNGANQVPAFGDILSNKIIGTYADYPTITGWLDDAATAFPELVELQTIGITVEGRDIQLAKIGLGSTSPAHNPVIWIDGGIHAREWISPASVLYVMYMLLHGYYNSDPTTLHLLQTIDWYILPVYNPDGYQYSHTHERFWRKNRKRNDGGCYGVDLNRNWPYKWDPPIVASTNPCSDTYRGESAGSEVEVQSVTEFISSLPRPLACYVDVHSYGQYWLLPEEIKDMDILQDNVLLGDRIVAAIAEVQGQVYDAGIGEDLLYATSGDSINWAVGAGNVKYAFLPELRDTGTYGFALPTNQIIPTGQELWAAMQIIGQQVLSEGETEEQTTEAGEQTTKAGTTTSQPTSAPNSSELWHYMIWLHQQLQSLI